MITRKNIKNQANNGHLYCPICKKKEYLVEHHIRGRKIPNPNHKSNLAYICPNCHLKIHKGIIILEGYFMTMDGLELFWHYKNNESITGENIIPHIY